MSNDPRDYIEGFGIASQEELAEAAAFLKQKRRERQEVEKYADQVRGPIRFAILTGESTSVGSFARISNGFEQQSAEVLKHLGDGAYLVELFGQQLVAHEAAKAWEPAP